MALSLGLRIIQVRFLLLRPVCLLSSEVERQPEELGVVGALPTEDTNIPHYTSKEDAQIVNLVPYRLGRSITYVSDQYVSVAEQLTQAPAKRL